MEKLRDAAPHREFATSDLNIFKRIKNADSNNFLIKAWKNGKQEKKYEIIDFEESKTDYKISLKNSENEVSVNKKQFLSDFDKIEIFYYRTGSEMKALELKCNENGIALFQVVLKSDGHQTL